MKLPSILIPKGKFVVPLLSGKEIVLPACHPKFVTWKGIPVDFSYGGKPILNYENSPMFAELIILRILQKSGWEGAWVETYGGINFLNEMPLGWKLQPHNIGIPKEKKDIILQIQKIAKTSACFDVFAWKGNEFVFCEAKNRGKDKLTNGQLKFIEGALSIGVSPESLLIVEWDKI